jgi:hypothetical protein
MSLLDRMYQDMKEAMKAGDRVRTETVRMTIAALKKEALDSRGALDEAAEIAVLQRATKQRREAAESFDKGGRPDLAQKERDEARILEAYLPRQLDDTELADAVKETIQATGAAGARDLGKVMGRLLSKYKGHVDGQRAREAVAKALGT